MRRTGTTIGVLLALCMALGLPAVGDASDAGGSFFDDDGNIHEGAIEAIAADGITRGCNPPQNTDYCPDAPVTRGEMAAFLVRALGLNETGGTEFVDDNQSVFEADIERLAAAGITRGCNPPDNDRFCPDQPVTRGQMAAFLVRAFGYSAGAGTDLFSDDDDSVFETDIDRLGTEGVTRGCNPPDNDLFCPNDPVLRDQMASFLSRALELSSLVPPDRADTAHGTQLNLIDIAQAQGCGATLLEVDGDTEECTASTSITGGVEFYVEHGWYVEGWSTLSAAEREAFIGEGTRFDLSLNGTPLSMFESFTLTTADVADDQFRFQFPGTLSESTHTLVGEWVYDSVVELRIILKLSVTP